jgi:hypothetical protein
MFSEALTVGILHRVEPTCGLRFCFLPGFGYLFRQRVTNASQSLQPVLQLDIGVNIERGGFGIGKRETSRNICARSP